MQDTGGTLILSQNYKYSQFMYCTTICLEDQLLVNRGNNLMKNCKILIETASSPVKRDLISIIKHFVYELPHECPNDLKPGS